EGQLSKGGHAVFSPSGELLAVHDKDHALGLWHISGKLIRTLPRPFWQHLAFSPDGRVLATSAQDDQKIHLWEATSGKELRQLTWDGGTSAHNFVFSPDGKRLVSIHSKQVIGYEEGVFVDRSRAEESIRVWDVGAGRQLHLFPAAVGMYAWTEWPVLSKDCRTLATAYGNTISLWELATGKKRAQFS